MMTITTWVMAWLIVNALFLAWRVLVIVDGYGPRRNPLNECHTNFTDDIEPVQEAAWSSEGVRSPS
jgi:hypothetical protein